MLGVRNLPAGSIKALAALFIFLHLLLQPSSAHPALWVRLRLKTQFCRFPQPTRCSSTVSGPAASAWPAGSSGAAVSSVGELAGAPPQRLGFRTFPPLLRSRLPPPRTRGFCAFRGRACARLVALKVIRHHAADALHGFLSHALNLHQVFGSHLRQLLDAFDAVLAQLFQGLIAQALPTRKWARRAGPWRPSAIRFPAASLPRS